MDDGSPQVARALIADVEYRFVEKLASATDGGEIVVCEALAGARRYATCETWEAGRARFGASRLGDEGVVTWRARALRSSRCSTLCSPCGVTCMRKAISTRRRRASVPHALMSGRAACAETPREVRGLFAS